MSIISQPKGMIKDGQHARAERSRSMTIEKQ